MLRTRLFNLLRPTQHVRPTLFNRACHSESTEQTGARNVPVAAEGTTKEHEQAAPLAFDSKYKVFRDEDATEIFDVEEQRQLYLTAEKVVPHKDERFAGLDMTRGIDGVYDVHQLVEVLKRESVKNLFVCKVPKEYKYVDYMVFGNCNSFRHMFSTMEFVRLLYKRKRHLSDEMPAIEGKQSKDWMAMDMGNLALHIFSKETRELYDLDSHWAIGSKYDREAAKSLNPFSDILPQVKKMGA